MITPDILNAALQKTTALLDYPGMRLTPVDADSIAAQQKWPDRYKYFRWLWQDGALCVEEDNPDGTFKCHDSYPADGTSLSFAVWFGQILCGLSASRMYDTKNGPVIEGHFRESWKDQRNMLRGIFTIVCEHLSACVAKSISCDDLRICDPLNEKLAAFYARFSYTFTDPPTMAVEAPFPCMTTTLRRLSAALNTSARKQQPHKDVDA
ncbi:MAG: hypothetical protein H6865_05670 [Rhodospirillales bacterium]|nr:hypothetical protein [Alphaproteobacteria bacterium]MCB9987109.1 hypothetical protein [Rhodospirillales bacterium]USO08132.1 MAG: hypothetical protein H6866_02625 [Rhodospirillales bacterium]